MNVKFIDAKQAKEIHQYQNIKRNPYRTKAVIWYNKTYPRLHIQIYKLLVMGGKATRNTYSADNNKLTLYKLHLVGYIKQTSSDARLHES